MIELKMPLSNIQMEILKLYAIGMSQKDLEELKDVLARFFAAKSIHLANEVWKEKNLTNDMMDKWLNGEE